MTILYKIIKLFLFVQNFLYKSCTWCSGISFKHIYLNVILFWNSLISRLIVKSVTRCQCNILVDLLYERRMCGKPTNHRSQMCDEHRKLRRIFCQKYHMVDKRDNYGMDRGLVAFVELAARDKYCVTFNVKTDYGHEKWHDNLRCWSSVYEQRDGYIVDKFDYDDNSYEDCESNSDESVANNQDCEDINNDNIRVYYYNEINNVESSWDV